MDNKVIHSSGDQFDKLSKEKLQLWTTPQVLLNMNWREFELLFHELYFDWKSF
jgi:hypothetical protein